MNVGVLGGGQLGRMLALAGLPLGFRFHFFEPTAPSCAAQLGQWTQANYDDVAALNRFVRTVDLVTYEFENIPLMTADHIDRHCRLAPGVLALQTAQDRGAEKALFDQLEIPVAPYRLIDSRAALVAAVHDIGLPAVLKTRRMGYDGKGQAVLRSAADVDAAWERLKNQPLIVEAFVPFDRELSCIGVRAASGESRFYPLSLNVHRDGILRRSEPSLHDPLQPLAERYARKVLDGLAYVGVMAFEFFACGERLLANEIAPRVHNSGHWTQDGARCSQFENHLRAISGLPLGDTAVRSPTVMFNLIGGAPPLSGLMQIDSSLRVHLYDKVPKPQRKLGHINVLDGTAAVLTSVEQLVEQSAQG